MHQSSLLETKTIILKDKELTQLFCNRFLIDSLILKVEWIIFKMNSLDSEKIFKIILIKKPILILSKSLKKVYWTD